jgi:hypothetical protein
MALPPSLGELVREIRAACALERPWVPPELAEQLAAAAERMESERAALARQAGSLADQLRQASAREDAAYALLLPPPRRAARLPSPEELRALARAAQGSRGRAYRAFAAACSPEALLALLEAMEPAEEASTA